MKIFYKRTIIILLTLGVGGFTSSKAEHASEAKEKKGAAIISSALSGLPDGIWEVEGYGLVLEVDSGAATVWQVTENTCVKGDDDFAIDTSYSTAVGDGYLVTQDAVVTKYHLVPTELPLIHKDGKTPVTSLYASLTALDETFTTYYPFFTARGFDWKGALAKLEAEVSSDDNPKVFKSALTSLTAKLGDGHTFVDEENNNSARSNAFLNRLDNDIEEAEAMIDKELRATRKRLQPSSRKSGADGYVVWGKLTSDVGYLGIDSFEEIGGEQDDVAGDLKSLTRALDMAFADIGDLPHLILDIRFNEGGLEVAALLAAGYFVDFPTPAFIKYAFAAPERTWQTVEITPSTTTPYSGQVILLTSPMTASAAEVFLLSVTGSTNAIVLGEPSAGEFGEVFDRVLPNGVSFAMSMEVYTTLSGASYEAQGVPVDISAAYNKSIDTAIAITESFNQCGVSY
jgi:C-terminal processing protease CtpA/Prc